METTSPAKRPKGLQRHPGDRWYWQAPLAVVRAGFTPARVRLFGSAEDMARHAERMNREAGDFIPGTTDAKRDPEAEFIAYVRRVLDYNPETGEFRWRQTGRIATKQGTHGYLFVKLPKRLASAHWLAWVHVHAQEPEGEIDHIDRNRLNNAIGNLRLATRSTNNANRDPRGNSTTGYKGLMRRRGRWGARVTKDGVNYNLGYFDSKEEAARAYDAKAEELYGPFARLNLPRRSASRDAAGAHTSNRTSRRRDARAHPCGTNPLPHQ